MITLPGHGILLSIKCTIITYANRVRLLKCTDEDMEDRMYFSDHDASINWIFVGCTVEV